MDKNEKDTCKKFSSPIHCNYEIYWEQLYKFIDQNSDIKIEELWNKLNYWDIGPSPEKFRTYEEAQTIYIPILKDNIYKLINLHDATIEKKEIIISVLSSQINEKTDVIIEIGGGWGRNIFGLYMSGKFNNIDFIMGEVSNSGQNICSKISNNYNIPIISTYFNYYDWKNIIQIIIAKKYKNICIFSNHSIEQIPYLNKKMFEDFINLDIQSLRFTHIEPIGFQLDGGNKSYTGKIEYNQNLYPILLELLNDNKIEIKKIIPDFFSIGGIINCGSLIQWEKI